MELAEGILMGFGNPLLDITCIVEDNVILEKYSLNANAAIIAEEKHDALFDELMNMENVIYSAGGACQNTMRIFQWIIQTPSEASSPGQWATIDWANGSPRGPRPMVCLPSTR